MNRTTGAKKKGKNPHHLNLHRSEVVCLHRRARGSAHHRTEPEPPAAGESASLASQGLLAHPVVPCARVASPGLPDGHSKRNRGAPGARTRRLGRLLIEQEENEREAAEDPRGGERT
ncbi:hypothetical protein PVAP13_1KG163605 [Panicum virgatum]|uniref:Uncharacterized protein n=1 Tax=Panicum virgatum TaxID=38727 RepID=A0A8T0XL56_PANVG|nr:hypothetical protein PVAP13_1KG163605 [Panicum virgatum]